MIYLYYSDCFLSYNFGPEHPLNPIRLSLSCKLIEEEGLLDGKTELVCPSPPGRRSWHWFTPRSISRQ